jgi:hypothetical protein
MVWEGAKFTALAALLAGLFALGFAVVPAASSPPCSKSHHLRNRSCTTSTRSTTTSTTTTAATTTTTTATTAATTATTTTTPTPTPTPGACTAAPPPGLALAFCDDFDGAQGSAPNSSKWHVYGGTMPNRWGSECFVNDRQHIYQDGDGHLVETATYNPGGVPCTNGSGPYESGGMDTGNFPSPLFSFEYGDVEAKIKVPCQSGYGMWPAWWTTGSSWPKGGEVDLLEVMANSSHGYNAKQSLHGATSTGGVWSLARNNISSNLWCDAYHVYGAKWSPGQLEFIVDGNVEATFTAGSMQSGWMWPFDGSPQKLFLDLQIGGSGGTVDNSTLPQSMMVDWVRVYH